MKCFSNIISVNCIVSRTNCVPADLAFHLRRSHKPSVSLLVTNLLWAQLGRSCVALQWNFMYTEWKLVRAWSLNFMNCMRFLMSYHVAYGSPYYISYRQGIWSKTREAITGLFLRYYFVCRRLVHSLIELTSAHSQFAPLQKKAIMNASLRGLQGQRFWPTSKMLLCFPCHLKKKSIWTWTFEQSHWTNF